MQQKKTVIVVGAGASHEARLPTSTELKRSIAKYLDIKFDGTRQKSGDRTIAASLQTCTDINQCLPACWKIRDALPQATSIDTFINSHQGNKEIELSGKLAIVRSILEAEKRSLLYIKRTNTNDKLNFDSLEETWFNVFWQRISEHCQAEGLGKRLSSIVLIVFNYDRCIEHFLYQSIQNYYGLSADNAASLVNAMQIFHPYGMVGSLPWTSSSAQMEFGAEPDAQDLVKLAEQIKTFTEGTNPEASDIVEIRKQVATADTLVFLGFAYHQQNLELLKYLDNPRNNKRSVINCYGTTVGISGADLDAITTEIEEYCNAAMFRNENRDLTCRELFNTYRRTLSFV